jgi:hypothetical protein
VERVTRSTAPVHDSPDARKYVSDLQIYRAAYRNRTDDLRITSRNRPVPCHPLGHFSPARGAIHATSPSTTRERFSSIRFVFPDKTITYIEDQVAHTNLDTGFTLTETDHVVETVTAADGQIKDVGLAWHLRTPEGNLVVVQAGQVVISADTGEVLKLTPTLNPDFAAVICPALGGHPAG